MTTSSPAGQRIAYERLLLDLIEGDQTVRPPRRG
jgi:glucose-6-phosphate 1-dehydrogenase